MTMTDVTVGRLIPLSLQVYDADATLKVQATLIDDLGVEFARVELVSVGKGLYLNYSIQMPDCQLAIAQYETSAPDKYEVTADVFKAIPKPIPARKNILGEIISRERVKLIQGVIER